MWKLLLLVPVMILLFVSTIQYQKKIKPTTYLEAQELATKKKLSLLVMFSSQYCQPCQKMKKKTLPVLIPQMEKHYVIYILDVNREHEIVSMYNRAGLFGGLVPTFYIITSDNKLLGQTVGFMTVNGFIKWHNSVYKNRKQKIILGKKGRINKWTSNYLN